MVRLCLRLVCGLITRSAASARKASWLAHPEDTSLPSQCYRHVWHRQYRPQTWHPLLQFFPVQTQFDLPVWARVAARARCSLRMKTFVLFFGQSDDSDAGRTLDLTARLSPTGSRNLRTPGNSGGVRGGLLDLLDIGNLTRSVGDGAFDEGNTSSTRSPLFPTSPLSPLDSTLEHLKNLVGVGGTGSPAVSETEARARGERGCNGSDQSAGFELKLGSFLHGVSAPGLSWRPNLLSLSLALSADMPFSPDAFRSCSGPSLCSSALNAKP